MQLNDEAGNNLILFILMILAIIIATKVFG